MSEPVTAEQAPRDGWRHFLVMLAMCAVGFLAQPDPAAAQVQTFTYQGPAFDMSLCGFGAACRSGSVTASVTIYGYASNYSGTISLGSGGTGRATATVSALGRSLTWPGGNCWGVSDISLTNGQVTGWGLNGWVLSCGHGSASNAEINTVDAIQGDQIEAFDGTSALTDWGSSGNTVGSWSINPKSFGIACARSTTGAVPCGEPIDLGSGNVFDQVTDYETAGQNKLSLIRYYNSFAMPDTYATSMAHNWRTNYDRYLHIINPSAIYGVEAERPDGQVITFSSSSGTYTPDSDVDLKLTKSGSTWTLTDRNDTAEVYFTSGSEGVLQSITQRNKYTQALTRTGGGQIAFVSDSYTRKLTFGYSAGLLTTVSTPEFTSGLTYGYVNFSSTGNQLQTVTYATSPATHQTYLYENAYFPYALTGITDENGNRYATWGYDGLGRGILSQLSGAVNYTSVYYNDANGNRVVKGPLGIVETYKFSTLQGVPKVKEIDRAANSPVVAASETFAYDSNGYRNSLTDWNGNNTSWVNNSHGMPTQISYVSNTSNKQITNITYDFWYPHLKHTVQANALNEAFTYSSSGNLLTDTLTDKSSQSVPYTTNGQTRTTTYTYNGTGQVLTVQLPRTDVTAKTTYAYGANGTLVSATDAAGNVSQVKTATPGGRPIKVLDQNSILTTTAYKAIREWPTQTVLYTSAGNLTTYLTYDSAGNLTKTTLPDGSYRATGYDSAHRPTSITNNLGESQGITYDSAGNVTQTLWKNSGGVTKRQHTATYDALGERLTDVGGVSQSTAFTYDKNGNVLTITDPLSHVTTQTFDQLNRLSTHKDAAQNLSSIKYDSHSRPLSITDPRSNVTSYVYDGFGDTIQQASPDTLTTIYFYDPDTNLTGKNEAGINFSSATYDADDRILTRTYPADSTLNVSITYDSAAAGYRRAIGRIASLTDQVGSLSRSYDERGNIITDARTISSQLYSNAYTYESAGRLSGITYASSGWKVAYTRDTTGQITAVTTTQPGHGATNLATSVTHMPFGPIASLTWGNGVTDARTFDLDYRMTSVKDVGTGNIQYLSYGYDADNNVHTVTDNVTPANNQTLTWDVIDRLTGATGSYAAESIAYDSNSNRKTFSGTNITRYANTDRMKKWGSSVVAYDSAGNMTGFSTQAFTYSKANRMATANPFGTTATYGYDAFGQRLKVKSGTNPFSVQIYDLSGHLLTETSAAATPVETDYVYLDDMPVAVVKPSTAVVSDIHTDRIGTPQFATSSTKTVVWFCNYQPFGSCSPTASVTQNNRLPGMYADFTVMDHNGFRDFHIGGDSVYTEADLIDKRIAPFGNEYNYANQNPTKYTDRFGLAPNAFQVVLGAAIGGFAGYEAPARSTTNRVIDTGIGAFAGGVAAMVSPRLSGAAARAAGPVAGFFTAEAVGGGSAVTGGLLINYVNGNPLGYDLGYALAIGLGAPFFSGESLLIGSGYLGESSIGAGNALALNTGVFTAIGILADPIINPPEASGLAGPPAPYGGGILINNNPQDGSACQVSSP
jgi:YD repeat-containing protein